MALVKITDGVKNIEVTEGAYNGIYKNLGFYPINEDAKVDKEEEDNTPPELTENEIFVNELMEKPISEWSKAEIKRFAELKEIDISGTQNAGQAKEIISTWLEENDK